VNSRTVPTSAVYKTIREFKSCNQHNLTTTTRNSTDWWHNTLKPWRQARQAERAATLSEGEAIASAQKAIEARDQATKDRDAKNAALTAEAAQRILADTQRDLAERQLIEGLLRPIGYGDEPNAAELRSFVDWSAIPDARLKLRIIEVACDSPEVALRVARRAERARQACVGLSPTRRARAIELMSAKQRDMNPDPRFRIAAVWLAVELGSTDSPALPEALTAELFVASLHRVGGGAITEQLRELTPQLERPTQERIMKETMTILLDYLALSESYFRRQGSNDLSVFSPGVLAMTNERSLASLLQHPAAIGKPRKFMLQRFEELVFQDGNHVLLPLPSEPPPRRFHNLHDAAAWIQQNWPEFDLEATHPVTWRGER